MVRILFFTAVLLSFLFSADIAIVKNLSGDVMVKRAEKLVEMTQGDKLLKNDILITKSSSSVGVIFQDGTVLSLGENSILHVDDYLFEPAKSEFKFDIKLDKGLATFESGKIGKLSPESVMFRIPEGTIGIRGTKFYVEVQ